MIQFIAGFFIGGFAGMFLMGCCNVASCDEGPMLPEVDEHGRTVYRSEHQE